MKILSLSENILASLAIISFSIATVLLSWLYKASMVDQKRKILTTGEANIFGTCDPEKSANNFEKSWILNPLFQRRRFIAVYIFILSIINFVLGLFHVFAWNMTVEKAGPYFFGSAIIGSTIQIFLAISTCIFSCLPSCKK